MSDEEIKPQSPEPSADGQALNRDVIRSKAVSGVKAMGWRTLVSILLSTLNSVILARLLMPKDYGVFGVSAAIAAFGLYIIDIGLISALVLQDHEPTGDEVATAFWAQQGLVTVAVVGILAGLPFLKNVYRLDPQAMPVVAVMTFALYLSSLRFMPTFALERQLRFDEIARCDVAESVVSTVCSVGLALGGAGVWALALSMVAGRTAGLIMLWLVSPFRQTKGRFRWGIFKRLLPVGLPIYVNTLLPAVLNNWRTLYVSRYLGLVPLGLINWSGNLAAVPLRLTLVLNRVAFPSLARLSLEDGEIGRATVSAARRIVVVTGIALGFIVVLCPPFVPLLFGAKWNVAIPLLQWFIMDVAAVVCVGFLEQGQSASGGARDKMYAILAVMALRWGGGFVFITTYGLSSVGPFTYGTTLFDIVLSAYLMHRRTPGCEDIFPKVIVPLIAFGFVTGLAVLAGHALAPQQTLLGSIERACVGTVVLSVLTLLCNYLLPGHPVTSEYRALYRMLKPVRVRPMLQTTPQPPSV